jgi:hypothetical protein
MHKLLSLAAHDYSVFMADLDAFVMKVMKAKAGKKIRITKWLLFSVCLR